MIERVNAIAHGKRCPKGYHYRLYQLADDRFKCSKRHAKYSRKKIKDDLRILHYFSLEISATKTAKDLRLSYPTVHNKYLQYRQEIVDVLDQDFRKLSGEIEYDESYFGGKKKVPRGRGSREKMTVFGMLERQNKIFIMFLLKPSWMRLKNMLKKAVFFIRILSDRTNR